MKSRVQILIARLGAASTRNRVLRALIAGLGFLPVGRATAQTFTTLHNFTALSHETNSDGASPQPGLILSGNTLYGTTYDGGSSGNGTVFAVNTNGTGFTNVHTFDYSDGANPHGGLILAGNTLYGTAYNGGSASNGAVFAVNIDGTGFTNLYSFTALNPDNGNNKDGANPGAGLVLSGNTLYGTASLGGSSGDGTVFAVNTNGTGFTNLHNFGYSDGSEPAAGLILSGNTVYGTAPGGGNSDEGAVFAVNTNGTGFTNVYSFSALIFGDSASTNGDGATPQGGLILSGDTLYGTAESGGRNGAGTLFAVNTNGTGFTNLFDFTALNPDTVTNSEGNEPEGSLVLSGNTLYGTADMGGGSDEGTVFAVNTDGAGFTNLLSFDFNSYGAYPRDGLILSGHTLYGTALLGGTNGNGTVFSLSLGSVSAPPLTAPQLTLILSGAGIILTWPANAAGYTLQSTTNLASLAVWSAVSPAPYVVDGQNIVINNIAGTQQFFRLANP
jgi:uncharacterized repeat protein (TIGR03803 family)